MADRLSLLLEGDISEYKNSTTLDNVEISFITETISKCNEILEKFYDPNHTWSYFIKEWDISIVEKMEITSFLNLKALNNTITFALESIKAFHLVILITYKKQTNKQQQKKKNKEKTKKNKKKKKKKNNKKKKKKINKKEKRFYFCLLYSFFRYYCNDFKYCYDFLISVKCQIQNNRCPNL